MIENASLEIIEKQIELAKKGNPLIARFLLERIIPSARSAPIGAPLALKGSPTEQAERVVSLLADGKLTLEEAAALLSAIAATQSIRDATELADRVAEIEARLAALDHGKGDPK
jgi:hypothetical protein